MNGAGWAADRALRSSSRRTRCAEFSSARDDVEGPEQLETMQPMSADGAASPAATGQQAIVAAFEAARARQKADWFEMSVAVLKNRILDITKGPRCD